MKHICRVEFLADGQLCQAASIGSLDYIFEHIPTSLVLVCQHCGELWARLITEGAEYDFEPIAHLCSDCGGGSLLALDFEYRVYTFSPELYSRELVLHSLHRTTPQGTIYA